MVDCKVCKHRFRFDHLKDRSQCPDCGSDGSFTEPRNFNLMMKTSVGPMEDTSALAYLRPETAQGIFVNFKNIYQTARKRPPFGVAQIGKSFRNEITPGNFTFRVREFEQAELEYFVPDDGKDMDAFHEWVERRKAWYSTYGIDADRLRFYELTRNGTPALREGRASTSSISSRGAGASSSRSRIAAPTISTRTCGSPVRTCASSTKRPRRTTRRCSIESSAGIDRTMLTFLIDAYERETQRRSQRQGDGAHRAALSSEASRPCKSAVFSLARNKPELVERARAIEAALRPRASARSTTKGTSGSSIGARTRSVRRFASPSITKRSTTRA